MLINSALNNNTNNKPSFKYWYRNVYHYPNMQKKVLYRNDTCFFRDEGLWCDVIDSLVKEFKDVSKINVRFYGSSNAEEIFTFLMRLIVSYPKEIVNKFTNVIARDIDPLTIEKARGFHTISADEKRAINSYTNNNFDRFISLNKLEESNGQPLYTISNELYDKIDLGVADIREDYKNIKPSYNFISMRNFFPYFETWMERQQLLRNIGKQMKSNSFIFVGEFDVRGTDFKINNEIIDAGFKRTKIPYLFKKVE